MHEDRRRAGSFGEDAEQYDRARPGYPSQLVDDLLVGDVRDVLDVGCGTGKVARLLAARGCRVLGVEPDPRMAAIARQHGLMVEESTFELWDPRGRTFDLVVAGQSWHWVEPDRGATKAASVLRSNGRLAVFWNRALLPPEVKAAFADVYARVTPGLDRHSILLGNVGDERFSATARSFRRDPALGNARLHTYRWQHRYTRDEWLDLVPTHSDHRTLPPPVLSRLLDELGAAIDAMGGSFGLTYETIVVSARRRPASVAPRHDRRTDW
ncbi:MAG TPA: class I SAM-dependent methyltransferase [Acidimicrobiales bacterium]